MNVVHVNLPPSTTLSLLGRTLFLVFLDLARHTAGTALLSKIAPQGSQTTPWPFHPSPLTQWHVHNHKPSVWLNLSKRVPQHIQSPPTKPMHMLPNHLQHHWIQTLPSFSSFCYPSCPWPSFSSCLTCKARNTTIYLSRLNNGWTETHLSKTIPLNDSMMNTFWVNCPLFLGVGGGVLESLSYIWKTIVMQKYDLPVRSKATSTAKTSDSEEEDDELPWQAPNSLSLDPCGG